MKKISIVLLIMTVLYSCESQKDSCIRRLVDEQGYSYDDACEYCDEMENDSECSRE